jgi:hypothetical protein
VADRTGVTCEGVGSTITVPKLLEAIEKNDATAITALKDGNATVFDKQEAQQILDKLRGPRALRLGACGY